MAKKPAARPFDTAFGFDKQIDSKVEERQPTTLEEAHSFWQRNQTSANMNQLLETAKPVIDKALMSYAGGDRSFASQAKLLAVGAFKTFDPKKGAKLKTHLLIRLQPLRREYTTHLSPLVVPERVQLDRQRIDIAEREFSELQGREPSDTEIADATGLSTKRIAHVKALTGGVFSEGRMVVDGEQMMPRASQVTPEDIVIEYVHHDLDPIDRKILEWKTGMHGKRVLSTNEIARRLRVTPSAVSQRAAKIALKLEAAKEYA